MEPKKGRYSKQSLGRHETHCTLCQHLERQAIEQEWVDWGNTSRIGKEYKLSRDTIYRHAHALGLFEKRQKNVRKALERMIEKAGEVEVTASAVVQAVQVYAKINSEGKLVERQEMVSLNELFDRMSAKELEAYAKEGTLPGWFSNVVGETPNESEGDNNHG